MKVCPRPEMSWLVFLCSSRFLKPKSSSTSSSSIHMCLICNDFQMWVVWLCSLASSEPKMVFGIAQRTFYLNRRETVIRRGGFTLSIHWTKKRRAILCSWKKQITKVTTVHFISSLLMPNVAMVMFFFCRFIFMSYVNRQRIKLFIGKEVCILSQSFDGVIAV